MWDGREPSLDSQAIDATIIHAQGGEPPDAAELKQIVDFENGIFTAQSRANGANDLTSNGVTGGSAALSMQAFFTGIKRSIRRQSDGGAI